MNSKRSIAFLWLALSPLAACSANVADNGAGPAGPEGSAEGVGTSAATLTSPRPKAYLGGSDVALVWESSPGLSYEVYRDGKVITPLPGTPKSGTPNTYIDRAVVEGHSYRYQVAAIDNGKRLPLGEAAVVVFSSHEVPVPRITIDLSHIPSGTPGRADLLEEGKNFLQTWYPKIVKAIASPDYLPPMDLTLVAHPDADCRGAAGWVYKPQPIVHICASASLDMALFVHESTHVIQVVRGKTLMSAEESIASWAGDLAIGQPNKRWQPMMSFFDDYEYGAYFYDWIASTYNKPDFVRDLNLVAYHDQYKNGAWLVQYTGLTLGQLWGNMYGATFSSPGALKNEAGFYAYPFDTNLGISTPLQLRQSPDRPERFFQGPRQGGNGPLRWEKSTCFGETSEHRVVIRDCKDGTAPNWRFQSGALINVSNGRCLQALDGVDAEGSDLVTEPCNGSATQRWQPLPL